jgi:hypothetical protein
VARPPRARARHVAIAAIASIAIALISLPKSRFQAMTFRPKAALLVAALTFAPSLLCTAGAASPASSPATAASPNIFRSLTSSATAANGDDEGDDDDDHACSFFLWDVLSLVQYKLCEHLLQRNVYEARGGKKMVRIRPGSALEYLYPLSRHAPDRCALCGHAFEDHLRRWWEKKGGIGTAYDRVLDEMYDEGVSVVHLGAAAAASKRSFCVYSFHRRYVEDIPTDEQRQGDGPLSPRSTQRTRSRRAQKIKAGVVSGGSDRGDKYEEFTGGPVPYRIPQFSPKGIPSLWKALVLLLARNMALDEVDKLIELETKENRLLEKRASMF